MADAMNTQRWLEGYRRLAGACRDRFPARRRWSCGRDRRCSSRASDVRCAPPLNPACTGSCRGPSTSASLLDMRRRVYETGQTEMLTRDKKNIIARTFVVWRIGDPLTFIAGRRRRERRRRQARRSADQRGYRHSGRARSFGAGVHESQRSAGGSDRVRTAGVDGARGDAQLWRRHRTDSTRAACAAGGERDRCFRPDARRAASIRGQVSRPKAEREASRSVPRPTWRPPASAPKARKRQARIRGESAAQVAKTYADAHRVDPGALPLHTLAGFPRQASHRKHVSDSPHRFRAFLAAAEQGRAVRKLGPPSEIGRLAAPVARLIDGAWQRMHWWVATMAVLYLLSGITSSSRRSGGDSALGTPGGRHSGVAGARAGLAVRLSSAGRSGRAGAGQARVGESL